MLFVPLKPAPGERDALNLFDSSIFESLWVECRCNFSKNCKSNVLLNITYNLLKKYQFDFVEQLTTNLDNASCESFMDLTLLGDYILDYLTPVEKIPGHSSGTLWFYSSISMFTNSSVQVHKNPQ